MDWFEKITGFQELEYEQTKSLLRIENGRLYSTKNAASYGVGTLELVSLADLRERVSRGNWSKGRLKASVVTGDVGNMHRVPENAGALFQVASQFNLLEMVSPGVTARTGRYPI